MRNPFGTMDVPNPNDDEVTAYVAVAILLGDADDANAARWASVPMPADPLDGAWVSRWNGGFDPTIAGGAPDKRKQGRTECRTFGDRVYLRFDWNGGRRHGLVDVQRKGANRLVGKYINLTNPESVRPWVGLIVDATRIDGRHLNGRPDFRR
jgi:hypothetical protein